MTHTFTLSDRTFTQKPLGAEESLYGFSILMGAIAALKPGNSNEAQALIGAAITNNAEALPKLARLFAGVCDVTLGQTSNGPVVANLAVNRDKVFQGKPVLQVAWVCACACNEYEDFLSESGRAPLLQAAKALNFLTTLIGGSGESQAPTNSAAPTP